MDDTTTETTTTDTTTESDMNFTLSYISSVANSSEYSSNTYVDKNYGKEIFVLFEFVVVLLEFVISILAAYKIPRWRRNHRNQMMVQLIVTNLMRCSVLVLSFYHIKYRPELKYSMEIIMYLKFYIDVVVIVTFCLFVKHMYETLILVIVKINQKKVYTIFLISWLVPVPLAVAATVMVSAGYVKKWTMRLILCSSFKWPLMFLGTVIYVIILYRVLTEKIRVFARNLTIITFSLCFLLNFYLFFKDIVYLWCFQSFKIVIISYTVGFVLNLLGLIVYTTYLILCHRTSKARKVYSLRLSGVDKNVTTV